MVMSLETVARNGDFLNQLSKVCQMACVRALKLVLGAGNFTYATCYTCCVDGGY